MKRQISTRPIGKTELQVTELGLGCAAMTGNLSANPDGHIEDAIEEALNNGVTYLDTAPLYGFGRSEHFVGRALRRRGEGHVLSSKVGRLLQRGEAEPEDAQWWHGAFPFKPVYDYGYDGVMRSYADSLQRLGLDRIDILLLHDIGNMQHGSENGPDHFRAAMSGGYRALDELRRNGDISAIGLGVNEREVCMAALDHGDWDCFLLAGRYTLLEQAPVDDLLPACERTGTSLIIGGPFNSGLLANGSTWNCLPPPDSIAARAQALAAMCAEHDVPMAAAALQFPLGSPLVSSVIPGPRSQKEAREISQWFHRPLPPSLWSDLKTAGLIHPQAPTP